VARFQFTVLDCPDPAALAAFYAALTGVDIDDGESRADWVQLRGEEQGRPTLAFQRAPGYRPPPWPDEHAAQQAHLDFEVPDLDEGEAAARALGARKAETQPGERFRVFADPAGPPFCLVLPRGLR